MSFFDGVFGTKQGSQFQAQSAPITDPTAIAQQQSFVNALAGQNGLANQSSVFNQLQGVASGQGPNPAQAMLNNATGQNIANQAALMAGQRGAGANAGLIARQAAQQGAATQQQALGQGAQLQAQQSLGALGQLGSLANQQVAQQQAGLGQLGALQLNAQGQTLQNIQQQNQANAGIAAQNAKAEQERTSGLISGIGSALSMSSQGGGGAAGAAGGGGGGGGAGGMMSSMGGMFAAHGGMIPRMADGGNVQNPGLSTVAVAQTPTTSSPAAPSAQTPDENINELAGENTGKAMVEPLKALKMLAMLSKGGNVPKGEPRSAYGRHMAGMGMNLKGGGHVPGQASVQGDSLKNDTVPAMLSPSEIVIPRSITMGKNPVAESAKFVANILKQKGKNK